MLSKYRNELGSLCGDAPEFKSGDSFGEGSRYYNWVRRGEAAVYAGIVSQQRFELDQARILLRSPHPEARNAILDNLAEIAMALQYGDELPEDAAEEYNDIMSDPDLEREVLDAARRMIDGS